MELSACNLSPGIGAGTRGSAGWRGGKYGQLTPSVKYSFAGCPSVVIINVGGDRLLWFTGACPRGVLASAWRAYRQKPVGDYPLPADTIPANTRIWSNVGALSGQRRKRWPNSTPTCAKVLYLLG